MLNIVDQRIVLKLLKNVMMKFSIYIFSQKYNVIWLKCIDNTI
jgi:hypothetical protein